MLCTRWDPNMFTLTKCTKSSKSVSQKRVMCVLHEYMLLKHLKWWLGIGGLTGSSGEGDSLAFTAQNYPPFQIHTGFTT